MTRGKVQEHEALAKVWKIIQWPTAHEVSQSKTVMHPTWYPVPNRISNGLCHLLQLTDGHAIYGCYQLMAQLSSRLPPWLRGWLCDTEGRALSMVFICQQCVANASLIERTVQVLSDPQLLIGWMVEEEMPPAAALLARWERARSTLGARSHREERRRDETRGEEKRQQNTSASSVVVVEKKSEEKKTDPVFDAIIEEGQKLIEREQEREQPKSIDELVSDQTLDLCRQWSGRVYFGSVQMTELANLVDKFGEPCVQRALRIHLKQGGDALGKFPYLRRICENGAREDVGGGIKGLDYAALAAEADRRSGKLK